MEPATPTGSIDLSEPSTYAAIVLYYRLGEQLEKTVASLLAQTVPPQRVVIVDNDSRDGVVEKVAERWGVDALILPTNGGYGAGMNAGADAIGRRDLPLLFLTHEVVLAKDCVEEMLAVRRRSAAAQVGPVLTRASSGGVWSAGGSLTRSGRPGHRPSPGVEDHSTAAWLDGACVLADPTAFHRTGGFDESYFLYWEDVDMSLRLAEHGPVVVANRARAAQETGTAPPYYAARNALLLWRRRGRRARSVAFSGRQVAAALRESATGRPERAHARLAGLRDGWRGVTGPRPSVSPSTLVTLANPLPEALSHFERELRYVLSHAVGMTLVVDPRLGRSVEGQGATARLLVTTVRLLVDRIWAAARLQGRTIVVLWPAFGYYDILTLLPLAVRNRVILINHDPKPLRRQLGHGLRPRRMFRALSEKGRIDIVCLGQPAARDLLEMTGVHPVVVPHPIRPESIAEPSGGPIRVLGQFKDSRNSEAVVAIGADDFGGRAKEVVGRGWPSFAGWTVRDAFVPEDEFEHLIRTAACVVIPYDHFYQSGVATRCLELGVPIVGPRHENLEELFGKHWPGLVDDQTSWAAAVTRVLSQSSLDELLDRRAAYTEVTIEAWRRVVSGPTGRS
ncbi:hypothetical protein AFL01nite_08100 [Aeromicrobium flavum]|uniref:Glycosyltransferase 2-like domain-containing protein n=1 Tax=Aeromicrobium flavum TaxID=416568 RepID=A0A512HSP6_9ACTN|nr:glycosyltransferase family 2 protein [Aeromicrobium flavum]GEO88483.1 hypothetical protein AFL01nite_08100 [Aeromicrobium flavum]